MSSPNTAKKIGPKAAGSSPTNPFVGVLRLGMGILLLAIGVLGLVLPILPGLLFLFLGLSLIWPAQAKTFFKKARAQWGTFRKRSKTNEKGRVLL